MRDVVIIGSGHNALIAACYLARDGLDVEVVESDTVLGGAVSTVERFPGYAVDRGSSAHVMIRHTGIIEELALDQHGLRYLDMDPWGWAPFAEQAIAFHVDLDTTAASIEAVCGSRDAEAYHRFATEWGRRNAAVLDTLTRPPTPWNLTRGLLRAGGPGRPRGSRPVGGEVARQFLGSADRLLDEHFTDERLTTALAWLAAQSGPPPHETATAGMLGWVPLMHRLPPGRPVGGSGALTQALAGALAARGGRLRLGDPVTRITRIAGRASGVLTASGEHLPARAVLAGTHVLTTARLLDDDRWRDRVTRHVRVGNGIGLAVRLGTTALPRYQAQEHGGAQPYGALQLLVPDRTALRRAYGEYLAGRTPSEPAVLAMTFSALDPTIAPAGRHAITLWAQWYPYALSAGGRWEEIAEAEADKVIAVVERYAPGFTATIEHRYVQTPVRLYEELGLHAGNVMHLEMALDSMFALRPLPELAGYRTPVPGLYLTGASTHPGGGVFGASGRSSAAVLGHDLRRQARGRRW
ncbi:MAG: phytoene desaturase family protein [Actinomycetes bacterium]